MVGAGLVADDRGDGIVSAVILAIVGVAAELFAARNGVAGVDVHVLAGLGRVASVARVLQRLQRVDEIGGRFGQLCFSLFDLTVGLVESRLGRGQFHLSLLLDGLGLCEGRFGGFQLGRVGQVRLDVFEVGLRLFDLLARVLLGLLRLRSIGLGFFEGLVPLVQHVLRALGGADGLGERVLRLREFQVRLVQPVGGRVGLLLRLVRLVEPVPRLSDKLGRIVGLLPRLVEVLLGFVELGFQLVDSRLSLFEQGGRCRRP